MYCMYINIDYVDKVYIYEVSSGVLGDLYRKK